jgi:NAD(P)-dependent dehydrogenase (short-subunit alcohol dehydrogenase family)
MLLPNRKAIVTGGNSGIGRGIVLRLAEEGADVAFCYLNGAAAAEEVASQVRKAGRRAFSIQSDLRDPDSLKSMMHGAMEELGGIDILVNNSGIARFAPFLEMSQQDWDDVLNTNLRAAFLCSQIAARNMSERRYGRIIHISSTFSEVAVPDVSSYCASKGGLVMLAKAMAVELGPLGVTVNCVGPSTIRTNINAALLDMDNMEAREAALNPTRRIGNPEDIAATVVFLASEQASWVNGQNIMVDGGLTALSPQPPYLD